MNKTTGFKPILILTAVLAFLFASRARAENYEWLKTQNFQSIFVVTDFNGCEFIADKLNETVKRTFSVSNIKTTISNSLTFQTTDSGSESVYELVDDKLTGNNKIILHIYGRCIRYKSGFIYQFDVHFGVNSKKYSQALLYSTPQHSVVGIDSAMGIDRTFRELMKNVVDDYTSANQ